MSIEPGIDAVESYIAGLRWGDETPELARSLVAGNIRAFAAHQRIAGRGISNDQASEPAVYERLDHINDQLHTLCRFLAKPHAIQAAPEAMDVANIALDRVHSLYMQLAFELRTREMRAAAHAQERFAVADASTMPGPGRE